MAMRDREYFKRVLLYFAKEHAEKELAEIRSMEVNVMSKWGIRHLEDLLAEIDEQMRELGIKEGS